MKETESWKCLHKKMIYQNVDGKRAFVELRKEFLLLRNLNLLIIFLDEQKRLPWKITANKVFETKCSRKSFHSSTVLRALRLLIEYTT